MRPVDQESEPTAAAAPAAEQGRVYGGISSGQRKAERRERFIQAGIVVFGRDGHAATTTRSLCAEAGLTQRYFYESFDSLEALFIAVATRLGRELENSLVAALEAAPDHPEARVRACLMAYFQGIRRDPYVGRILLVEVYAASGRLEPMVRQFVATFTELMRSSIDTAFPQLAGLGVNVRLLAAGYIGATHHIALNWVLGGYAEPLEEVAGTALRIFAAPLRELGLTP